MTVNTEYLVLTQVDIEFDTPKGVFKALDNVNLKIAQGEFISLIGHSGCGKSTVLNIVAGLLKATAGGVILDGREVDEPGPDRAVVFQNHSLLPWLTAYENVELAVKQVFKGKKSKQEMDEWIRQNLELVHMGHAINKRPHEISGGMKQRVGIARALAMEPKVLLMDEPFGALDALTRAHMQDSLMEIQNRLNNTVIMITHDVDEAVLLSDRIVMMTNGPAATVGEILHVDLPRPRERLALADDPHYNHYRAEVLRFLHERHRKPDVPTAGPKAQAPSAPPPAVAPVNASVPEPSEKKNLTLGFMPLTDCAPLVVAKERGFFSQAGLDVTLQRETSWANLRDKVAAGVLDGAQMLAPMVLAASARHPSSPLITAINLDLNGNAITVGGELFDAMTSAANGESLADPLVSARALSKVVGERTRSGVMPLTFAVVFPDSTHNLLLRYWMATAGIDPDKDVRIIVVPPAQMVPAMRGGDIAGFCVGEPWSSVAVEEGIGRILHTSSAIWNNHPEKVLGVTAAWAQAHPNTHEALIAALIQACQWLDEPANRESICEVLSGPDYVDAPVASVRASLLGTLTVATKTRSESLSDFNVFHRYSANLPWHSHAVWFLRQELRWGLIEGTIDASALATVVYRPDIYRRAAARIGLTVPSGNFKCEGEHKTSWTLIDGANEFAMGADLFCDRQVFDAMRLISDVAERTPIPLMRAANDA